MILGERVRFRAIEREDIPRFLVWMNDPEVTAGLMLALPIARVEEEGWYEHMIAGPAPEHPLAIEARLEDGSWQHIGNCGFHEIDWRLRSGEVGIVLGEKQHWNKGYGTAAMRLLLKHGFETLNLNRIMLRVYATNPRAVRSYEKCGFVHEGRLRQGMYKNGQYIDILLMSVLRAEWQG